MLFKKKRIRRLKEAYGKKPDGEYYDGDMTWIRSYYDDCRKQGRDPFYVDDTTWNDLNMDAVYKRINACQSTAGEQCLYYMLRRPMDRETFRKQTQLTEMMEQDPEKRLKLQLILSRMGVYRPVYLGNILTPQKSDRLWLAIYWAMFLFLPVSIICFIAFGNAFLWMPLLSISINSYVHLRREKKCEMGIRLANYCVLLVKTLDRMKKLKDDGIDRYLEEAYTQMKPLRFMLRGGGIVTDPGLKSDLDYILSMLMLDLIYYERIRTKLAKFHENFKVIHEGVGGIDAAISTASCKASLETACVPEIDYEAEKPYLHAAKVVHLMLAGAVPNDAVLDKSLLITGSNASGKSTYLRAVILSALMAQTIGICPCESYRGSPFRIYTSMALSDDLLAGESYFMAEIKSLKRILDDRGENGFVLCAVDEVLRGTNTVERVAASAQVLEALEERGTLCLIATHDVELCDMAGDGYEKAHFEERISDTDVVFDYRIKPGPATTRNAIHLLKLMGFDEEIVQAAHARADRYVETGKWIN